jgi:AcrR family transcriptional regulator
VDDVQLSRRERKRKEAYQEIVDVSRRLLNAGADMSLRAVATEMGMTPPGLYRYVDSVEALNALVAGGILTDVIGEMGGVRNRHPDDPAAQLAAVTAYFRSWALARTMEFQLVFATWATVRQDGGSRPLSVTDSDVNYPSGVLSDFFGEMFIGLCVQGKIKAPSSDQLGSDVVEVVMSSLTDAQRPLVAALGDRGPGTIWLLKLAWARLYGVLTMEVFGQIERPIIESGLLFVGLMRETFGSLGMDDDWDRLLAISNETAARESPYRPGD